MRARKVKVKNSIRIILLFSLFSFSTYGNNKKVFLSNDCDSIRKNYVILDYRDFGPPSMSFELLGQSWWSWESSGGSDPNEKHPIKVVVYTNVTLDKAKSKYAVVPTQKQDYRYISLKQVVTYLNKNIKGNALPSITMKLVKTRNLLLATLKE